MVSATAVPDRAPSTFRPADIQMAVRIGSTRVETTVAIALAVS